MKTFRINEADVADNPLADLDKQIDALFAELKQKIRDLEAPYRQQLQQQMQQWLATNRQKQEWNSLKEYRTIKEYHTDFCEAVLNTADIDKVLDEYKEKLRQMVSTFIFSQKVKKPRTPMPAPTANDAPIISTDVGLKEPEASPNISAEPKVEPEPEPQPAATATPPKVEPKQDAEGPQPDQEELALMKLGASVLMARDMTGKSIKELTPQDIEMANKASLNYEMSMSDKAAKKNLQAAREYRQHLTDASLDRDSSPTKAKMGDDSYTLATDDTQTGKKKKQKLLPVNPSRQELIDMDAKTFKRYILHHDPEGAISSGPYAKTWNHRPGSKFREEMVDNHLNWKKHNPKAESLQDIVNTYKRMLRESNRPERLLHEVSRLPFSERVSFYKKKLRSSMV